MPKSKQELERLDDLMFALDPNDGDYSRRLFELMRGCTQEDMFALAEISERRAASLRQLDDLPHN